MRGGRSVLHHDLVSAPEGEPLQWLLVLHGIYGAGRNWGSVARRLVEARPDWGAALVDLRQHGESLGFDPPHTLGAAADDLRRLSLEAGLEARAVAGHSFGGKVALVYAKLHPESLRQVWVIDSTPDARTPSGSAWDMLGVLRSLPGPFERREDGVEALVGRGLARPLARWMATNLAYGEDGWLHWRIDPVDMEALLRDFFATDVWDVVEAPPPGLTLHVVKAEESNVLGRDACARIVDASRDTGRVFLHRVAGGHWVNADNPEALIGLMTERL